MDARFLNRDLSWLSFNGRVLDEAGKSSVPLMERIRFLSIFSSNLDEFYRVRIPALSLRHEAKKSGEKFEQLLSQTREVVQLQQEKFGMILRTQLIPLLQENSIHLLYNKAIPVFIEDELKQYFQSEAMAFLEVVFLSEINDGLFLTSNALYQAVIIEGSEGKEKIALLNIPSNRIARFFSTIHGGIQYIIFLEDIVKRYLYLLFPGLTIKGAYNIKITRDAELDLADEYNGDLAEKIERQLAKRDDGYDTRFLYQPGISLRHLDWLMHTLKLSKSSAVEGGNYHNLKDLGSIPVERNDLNYPRQPPLAPVFAAEDSIFKVMQQQDRIVHTPYQSYRTILRFFNEAAVDRQVQEIFVTLYRVAGDSRIVNALITAAKNGKKVTVFIELKARFDEENNLRWSKKMKAAGVIIINSIPGLKVHAKVALVKRKTDNRVQYYALLATGNLNETTARFYTDHVLLTCHVGISRELELLFVFLTFRRRPTTGNEINFQHLLVAQFNLQQQFLELIDVEIQNQKAGKPAGIIIKMNNLEEKILIGKLYEASQAGVPIQLIVRSICCLEAGVPGMSDNITVTRIVDRYLEHGRMFVFKNAGSEKMFLGSADWMNRNIYRRIEVCFPVYEAFIKKELLEMITLQLNDTVQAVTITAALDNEPVMNTGTPVQSQAATYTLLEQKTTI